jgi:hypothetical protein
MPVANVAVAHRLSWFMHVAVHMIPRVACHAWPPARFCQFSAAGGLPGGWCAWCWRRRVDIRSAQKLAWENKLAKGFNTTDVPLEFCLLSGEVAEAFDAWRKRREQVAEELADTAIFLLGLAEMVGADLQQAVEAKLAKNQARVYQRLPNGVLVKDSAGAAEAPPP